MYVETLAVPLSSLKTKGISLTPIVNTIVQEIVNENVLADLCLQQQQQQQWQQRVEEMGHTQRVGSGSTATIAEKKYKFNAVNSLVQEIDVVYEDLRIDSCWPHSIYSHLMVHPDVYKRQVPASSRLLVLVPLLFLSCPSLMSTSSM